jgi:hypothetical protein
MPAGNPFAFVGSQVADVPVHLSKLVASNGGVNSTDCTAAETAPWNCRPSSCYKSEMSKIIEQWLLFEYVGLEFTPLSKPFKTKEQAEKARENTRRVSAQQLGSA